MNTLVKTWWQRRVIHGLSNNRVSTSVQQILDFYQSFLRKILWRCMSNVSFMRIQLPSHICNFSGFILLPQLPASLFSFPSFSSTREVIWGFWNPQECLGLLEEEDWTMVPVIMCRQLLRNSIPSFPAGLQPLCRSSTGQGTLWHTAPNNEPDPGCQSLAWNLSQKKTESHAAPRSAHKLRGKKK